MARWSWQERSVGFARQSDLTTTATTGFAYIPAEVGMPEFVRSTEEFQFGTSQAGAMEAPVTGSKHGGTFTVRFPLQSMLSGYDGSNYGSGITQTNDVIARTAVLFQHAIGGNTGGVSSNQDLLDGKLGYDEVYDATGTAAGSTTGATNVAVGTGSGYDEGNLLFASTATNDTSPLHAWIKTQSTDALTHAEASAAAAATSDIVWPTNTCPYTGDEPDPLTFYILGDQTQFGIKATGCIPQSWTFAGSSGSTPTLEITYVCTNLEYDDTIGGLQTKAVFARVPPALGGRGAYVAYGDTGSAASKCGVHDFTISGENTIHFVPCHSKDQGFSDFVVTGRQLTASFAIDHQSSDAIAGGEHIHGTDFRDGTAKSLSLFVGYQPGTVFACFLPSWHIASQPTLEEVEGAVYHRLNLRAGEYAGDTGSAKAADSIFRIAFG